MNVAYHFGASIFTMDVAVKVAFLPELLALASQFTRSDLLYSLEKLGHEDRWWLVDEQMYVLGHQDVGVDPRLMSCTSQFQYGLNCVLGVRRIEKRETVKATESDKVESFCFLEPFQTVRHGSIIVRRDLTSSHPPAHRDKAAMNGAQLFMAHGDSSGLMNGPPAKQKQYSKDFSRQITLPTYESITAQAWPRLNRL
jgi:hypothetical protein